MRALLSLLLLLLLSLATTNSLEEVSMTALFMEQYVISFMHHQIILSLILSFC